MNATSWSEGAPALRVRELTAGYGRVAVLEGISFEARRGELLAVVGPNGAGKSTLLRILGGTLKPWSGSVELMERPLADYDRRGLARIVASVAQENTVAFGFNVVEVVLMGRAPHLGPFRLESTADLEIAHDALAHFGLLELACRPIHELSGGERKRVFLARALAQEPRIALLDEPTAFLDLRHVAEIFTRFRDLCTHRGITVVATLHDLNAAALWANRVLLLKAGKMIACGRPEQIFTAENVRMVYETEVYVGRNPTTGAIAILPAAPKL